MARVAGVALVGLALALGGCATRGAMTFDCAGFAPKVVSDPPFVRSIKLDQDPVAAATLAAPAAALVRGCQVDSQLPDDPMLRSMLRGQSPCPSLAAAGDGRQAMTLAPGGPTLLLSGGGQWGAFGIGFLRTLREIPERARYLKSFDTITGISTGAVQAVFLGAADYAELDGGYRIEREGDVVNRDDQLLAVVTGSVAGLKPLRRRIEQALCSDARIRDGKIEQCAVYKLGTDANIVGKPQVFVGFVRADTGEFQYAAVNELAKQSLQLSDRAVPQPTPAGARAARQCVAGAVMASAAVPVFYQQIRIRYLEKGKTVTRTFYDGGVRSSVFEAGVALRQEEVARLTSYPAGTAPKPGTFDNVDLFVIRNGPTDARFAQSPNVKADALTNAMRGYSLLVNQLEVGSIAALRAVHPKRDIALITADGWATAGACQKVPEKAMFSPTFMECLTIWGGKKAMLDRGLEIGWGPWIRIAFNDDEPPAGNLP